MTTIRDSHDRDRTRTAFLSWIASRPSYGGDPAKAWEELLPAIARLFLRSEPARELRDEDGIDVDALLKAQQVTASLALSGHKAPVPVTPVTPVTPVVLVPQTAPVPHTTPVIQPQPAPVPAPVPAPAPVPTPVPAPNPLMDLIAQGLRDMGFAPQHALTADSARSIAYESAFEVVQLAIDELEKQGKLKSTQAPHFKVTVRDLPTREIQGTPPKWFTRALKYAQVRQPILLVGPAGSGKSYGAKLLAEALGLPFAAVSLSAGVDEGTLQGWLLPVGAEGTFAYVPSVVAHAYEHGGVVLFDEVDAADPNMLLILNAALDQNDFWSIPIRYGQPMLKKSPDFLAIGAANTFGHGPDRKYVGRNQLDGATLSRFKAGQIYVDYDESVESRLYPQEVYEFGHRARARCRALGHSWTRDISTRDLEAWSRLMAVCPSIDEAAYGSFTDWSPQELDRIHAAIDHDAGTVTLL